MAAIFPPADKGGVPPGPNVVNGFIPANAVIGEGPLYTSTDCTTLLTADQLNAMVSELLAAVDHLGFAFNTSRIDNLGVALSSVLTALQNEKVNRAGDAMTGPLQLPGDPVGDLHATTKAYVDAGDAAAAQHANAGDAAIRGELAAAIAALDAAKVSRAGDGMTGPLLLNADPTELMGAATKAYVDAQVAAGGGGGGGGGIPEAPFDDSTYGRRNQAWTRVLPLAGGTVTGPITLPGDPPNDASGALMAVPRQYVDAQAGDLQASMVRHDMVQDIDANAQRTARQNIYAAPIDAMAEHNILLNPDFYTCQYYGLLAQAIPPGQAFRAVDQWQIALSGGVAVTGSQIFAHNANPPPPGYNSHLQLEITTGMPSIPAGGGLRILQPVEGLRTRRLAWGTSAARPVALGFWVRANRPGPYSGSIFQDTATPRSLAFPFTINASNVWEWKTVVIPGDTGGTWLALGGRQLTVSFNVAMADEGAASTPFEWLPNTSASALAGSVNGAAAATDRFAVTGVVMLAGNELPDASRAPFLMRHQVVELPMLQRYFQKSYRIDLPPGNGDPGSLRHAGFHFGTTQIISQNIYFMTRLRDQPLITLYSPQWGGAGNDAPGFNLWQWFNVATGVFKNPSSSTVLESNDTQFNMIMSMSGGTHGLGTMLLGSWTASAFL